MKGFNGFFAIVFANLAFVAGMIYLSFFYMHPVLATGFVSLAFVAQGFLISSYMERQWRRKRARLIMTSDDLALPDEEMAEACGFIFFIYFCLAILAWAPYGALTLGRAIV